MIRVRTGMMIGAAAGLVLGFLLLGGVSGGPLFGLLVGGFIGFDITWALRTIRETKDLSKSIKDKDALKQDKSAEEP
ncbi:MAG: hypothetical protein H6867_05745 [Rhodospirillales bacterium]|nr:hypothetical protein [Rhodospirillales bacterium]MCB9995030.1 hypothetical protein [Rhodospirillales bacterium]